MASVSQSYWRLVHLAMAKKERELDEFGNTATEARLRSILKFRLSWLRGEQPSIPDDDHLLWNMLMDYVVADAKTSSRHK